MQGLHHTIIALVFSNSAGHRVHAFQQIAGNPAAKGIWITQHNFLALRAQSNINIIGRFLIAAASLRANRIYRLQISVVAEIAIWIHRRHSQSQLSLGVNVHKTRLQIGRLNRCFLVGIQQIFFTRLQSHRAPQRLRA